ncbi:MAG TPA: Ig-like domain-containing protein [Baekduia sp.]|uniref:Ig-like domain-containing protein n=1 Tax=Baekduia sp. TaxID=2600305 RepID=UPI002D7661A5|nr:Ig-like domain-containing protein [Baekduia sp.]HET6507051.1 Ig-like domain-containing protein [Baekduia sp.]
MLPRTFVLGTMLTILAASGASAATITVPAGDTAALVSAIATANATPGADTVEVSGTYTFSAANNFWYGPNALPAITSDVTIEGDADHGAVIASTNATRLRLFYVADTRSGLSAGTLTLRDLEVTGGSARGGNSSFGGGGAGLGGAIYNQGTLRLDGVTLQGNRATGGTAGAVNSTSGGGLGEDAVASGGGGGFGGTVPGGGAGGAGGAATTYGGGGGGGGGYASGDVGQPGVGPVGGAGGGVPNGLGGANSDRTRGGNGSGAGGSSIVGAGPGGSGGGFGHGGGLAPDNAASNRGGGGGGGVGGGGAGAGPGDGGGGGGFGGGGGWSNLDGGDGGFGAGGAGTDGRNSGAVPGHGGFGGGDGGAFIANSVSVGGGGAGMGGAVFNDRGTVTATNSTFAGNAVVGGGSTAAFVGGTVNAGGGGAAYGAALFNLNGTVTLTHVTIAGNSATAGVGVTTGLASGAVATVGYDTSGPATAGSTARQSIVTAVGSSAVFGAAPSTVADGTANSAVFSSILSNATYVGTTDPNLAPLGDYGGPTRTMPPNPGSGVIGGATAQNLVTTDQRGFTRAAPFDVGAVQTVATTVTADHVDTPYAGAARNVTFGATVAPARGATGAGNVTFTLGGGLGSGSGAISGGTASKAIGLAGGTAPGDYTITASAAAAPGFAAGSGTETLHVLQAPQVCADVTGQTLEGDAVSVAPDCGGDGPATIAVVGAPAHGTATAVGGHLRYTPDPGFFGDDTFTYTSTNEGGASNVATATVTVQALKPVCSDVTAVASAGIGRVVALDCASEIAQTHAIVAGPAHGTLGAIGGDGKVTYTADDDYAGTDTFTYRSTNATGAADVATVTLDVKARPTLSGTRGHAVVDGRFDPVAGATIEVRVYADASCTGTVVHAETVVPDASGAVSIDYTPTEPGSYGWQSRYSGDANNLPATSACEAQVIAAPMPPAYDPPAPRPPVPAPARECGTPVTLLDVSPVGTRARVSGVAHRALAGQAVTILRGTAPVGTATVGVDGAFSALVGGPAKADAAPVKYTVMLGADRSRAFRYDRLLRITGRSGLKVSGRLALKRPPSRVTISRENVCTGARALSTTKVSKNGTFSFTMRTPDSGSPYALYRVSAKVGGGHSYSTEVAVTG